MIFLNSNIFRKSRIERYINHSILSMSSYKQLRKSSTERMISGVCGGLAEYFGVDPTLVRIAYVALSVFSAVFPGILVYIILMIIMPE